MDKFELNGPPTIRAERGLVLLTLPIIIRTRSVQSLSRRGITDGLPYTQAALSSGRMTMMRGHFG